MANSIAAVQPFYGHTVPVYLELAPKIAGNEEGIEKMAAMIRAILEEANTLLNINIIDERKVLEAHKNSSLYKEEKL